MRKKRIYSNLLPIIFIILLLITILSPFVLSININNMQKAIESIKLLDIDWWPMFHHDPTHIGISKSSAPEKTDVLWSYKSDNFIYSSPIISNGRVYVSSMDGNIYCFDMMNGNVLWNYLTLGQITSSPTYYNNMIYIGSQDSFFYCLNAETGSLIWKFKTNFMIESSATIKDDRVYFGSSDGLLYCLNADNGNLIWSYQTGNVIWSSPAITDDYIYFGGLNGVFYCLNTANGNLVWSYTTNSSILTSPAVYNDSVFFGSNDNNVYCLNAYYGNLIWSYDTGNEVHSSPAIAYGHVYIGSSRTGIFCLNLENGNLVWEILLNNGISSSPSIADNKIYFGTDPCCGGEAYFLCFDAFSGEELWAYNVGALENIRSSPAIASGEVVVTTIGGQVISFWDNKLFADANGPYNNFVNETIQFNGDVYGGTPGYTWFWDFGDNATSTVKNPTHIYNKIGKYNVILTVKDSKNIESTDITYANIFEFNNNPPSAPVVNGPKSVKINKESDFFFNSTDPNDNQIYYYIDWGDESNSGWLGPYASGYSLKLSHTWTEKAIFTIKCKAKDIYGAESDYGTLKISIPRNIIPFDMLVQRFIQMHSNLFSILQKLLNRLGK